MAVIHNRGPIPRVRGTRFGGAPGVGSKFSSFVSVNTSGLEAVANALDEEFLEGLLQEVGNDIHAVAEPMVPVRTGELKGSKYVNVKTDSGRTKMDAGYSANHAPPVEFGAQGREARPFLRPAFDEVVGSGRATQKIHEALGRKVKSEVG